MRRSDSLPPVSPRFVAFAWRYHRGVLFAPSGRDDDRGLRGVVIPVPEPERSVETAGSLRFLGNPSVPMPCSRTPVGPRTPGHCGASTWPPLGSTTKAPAMREVSGLNHTALGLAVYASQWRSPDTTQDSLPAARPSLAGRDSFYPQSCYERFLSSSLIPLSQADPDAMTPTLRLITTP